MLLDFNKDLIGFKYSIFSFYSTLMEDLCFLRLLKAIKKLFIVCRKYHVFRFVPVSYSSNFFGSLLSLEQYFLFFPVAWVWSMWKIMQNNLELVKACYMFTCFLGICPRSSDQRSHLLFQYLPCYCRYLLSVPSL